VRFILDNLGTISIAALLLLGAGSYFYIKSLKETNRALEAEKRELNTRLSVSNRSIEDLRASIDQQNSAIAELKKESDQRQARAAQELAAANMKRQRAESRARQLMNKKIPAGKDVCTAANDLINEEIKRAR
jgi:peptidoglycan hydrolase CwlO-like protein